MKKAFIILFSALSIFSTNAQRVEKGIGINTTDPKGILHVHSESSDASGSNDFIVTDNTGNIGIGTISPTEKLQVIGNTVVNGNDSIRGNVTVTSMSTAKTFRIGGDDVFDKYNSTSLEINPLKDGTIGKNRKEALHLRDNTDISSTNYIPVATVDNNGMLGWADLPYSSNVQIGTLGNNIRVNPRSRIGQPIKVSTRSITLTPGKWIVMARAGVRADRARALGTAGFMDVWMLLAAPDLETNSNTTVYDGTGVYPEASGFLVSGPQMLNVLDVTSNITLDVYISTSIINSYDNNDKADIVLYTTTQFADLTFMAVKID